MKVKEIFKLLTDNKIEFVIIGGLALNIYGSNRVTFDSDIAIKTIEIDSVIELMIKNGLQLVIGVDKDNFPILTNNINDAIKFTEKNNWGFLKFLAASIELDVLFEIPIPFTILYKNSNIKNLDGLELHIASLKHIKIMKEKSIKERDDEKRNNDLIDLKFIENELKDTES